MATVYGTFGQAFATQNIYNTMQMQKTMARNLMIKKWGLAPVGKAEREAVIGFSGLLAAGYMEGKQNNDAATLASYKKLAGNVDRDGSKNRS
jgi:hypothetical protein